MCITWTTNYNSNNQLRRRYQRKSIPTAPDDNTALKLLQCVRQATNRNISAILEKSRFAHAHREGHHVAFLKVYKAASTTVQNILYRFGLKRNLSFVLPRKSHILSKSRTVHKPVYAPLKGKKFDILANHAVFNYTVFSELLYPDAGYIGIVREPLSQFVSAALYYRDVWSFDYLTAVSEKNFLRELLRHPDKFEEGHILESKTYNSMAYDFGFPIDHVGDFDNFVFNSHLNFLDKVFSLVLIVEHINESLVLLKRYLNWELKDILYIKRNSYEPKSQGQEQFSEEDIEYFKFRNHMDYKLYAFFQKRFQKQLDCEGPEILDEVRHFRAVRKAVEGFCQSLDAVISRDIERFENITNGDDLLLDLREQRRDHESFSAPASKWNNLFTVTKYDCSLMLTDEITFYYKLLSRVFAVKAKIILEDIS